MVGKRESAELRARSADEKRQSAGGGRQAVDEGRQAAEAKRIPVVELRGAAAVLVAGRCWINVSTQSIFATGEGILTSSRSYP